MKKRTENMSYREMTKIPFMKWLSDLCSEGLTEYKNSVGISLYHTEKEKCAESLVDSGVQVEHGRIYSAGELKTIYDDIASEEKKLLEIIESELSSPVCRTMT